MHTQYNISYVSCQINCLQSVFKHTKHRDLKCRLSTLQANSARYLNPPLPVSPRGKPGRAGSPHAANTVHPGAEPRVILTQMTDSPRR